jgi:hypothetical protein
LSSSAARPRLAVRPRIDAVLAHEVAELLTEVGKSSVTNVCRTGNDPIVPTSIMDIDGSNSATLMPRGSQKKPAPPIMLISAKPQPTSRRP